MAKEKKIVILVVLAALILIAVLVFYIILPGQNLDQPAEPTEQEAAPPEQEEPAVETETETAPAAPQNDLESDLDPSVDQSEQVAENYFPDQPHQHYLAALEAGSPVVIKFYADT